MGFTDHDDEINYDEYLSLSDLAHEVRWAWLTVNAAIPLGETAPAHAATTLGFAVETVPDPQDTLAELQAADRSALRAIAFEHVLAQLSEFDFKVPPAIARYLLAGRMPPATGNLEG